MKITFTIQLDTDQDTAKVTMQKREKLDDHFAIAPVAPPPIPPEPEVPQISERKPGSGPQFDPGFLAIVRDAHEPWTRRSIAVASGLKVEDVTQRLLRMKHKGWIEQPSPGLWRKTKEFGLKV